MTQGIEGGRRLIWAAQKGCPVLQPAAGAPGFFIQSSSWEKVTNQTSFF